MLCLYAIKMIAAVKVCPNLKCSQEMNKNVPNRLLLPDVLKGVAVLLMIQVHLMEQFATQEIYDSIWGRISLLMGGPPAAPVFMAVMGYFLVRAGSAGLPQIFRGIRLLIYGFLLNLGLNLNLFYHIVTGELSLDPLPYIFGVDILFLAGLSVIAIAVFRIIFADRIVWWVLLTLLVASATLLLPSGITVPGWQSYLLACFYQETWWSYFPLFPWLAYPMAGYTFHLISNKYITREISAATMLLPGSILFILLLFTFSWGLSITADLSAYYHHALAYFLWAMMFVGVWVIVTRFIVNAFPGNIAVRYLQWTGKNVTAFYVFQWLIIGNFATVVYKTVPANALVLWFAGITTVTGLLVWLYVALKGRRKEFTLK